MISSLSSRKGRNTNVRHKRAGMYALTLCYIWRKFWPSFDLSLRQSKVLITEGLALLIILQGAFEAPKAPYLIPSSGCLIYLYTPFYLWTSPACKVPMCMRLNLIFFCQSASCWSVYPASQKEPEKGKRYFSHSSKLPWQSLIFFNQTEQWLTCMSAMKLQKLYSTLDKYLLL